MTKRKVLILVDEFGEQPPPQMTNEQEEHLGRQADLYAAFQWGQEAASQGNVEDARAKFLEQYGTADTEAASQFDLGVSKALRRTCLLCVTR